jgi:hypothetical protein
LDLDADDVGSDDGVDPLVKLDVCDVAAVVDGYLGPLPVGQGDGALLRAFLELRDAGRGCPQFAHQSLSLGQPSNGQNSSPSGPKRSGSPSFGQACGGAACSAAAISSASR